MDFPKYRPWAVIWFSLSSVLRSRQQNGFQCCSRETSSECTDEVLHAVTACDKKTKLFEKKKLFDVGKKYVNNEILNSDID